MAVETLQPSEVIATAEGHSLPLVWRGYRRVDCRRHPTPELIQPVQVAAEAFAPGAPARDLWLSPDHAVFLEGVLIPVKYLINGATVAQVPRDWVEYWHVELPRHAVILAEGLAVESYLDTGNRHQFENGAPAMALHPDFRARSWADACAPLCLEGPAVLAAREILLARIPALGWQRVCDPDLRVTVNGRAIAPATVTHKLYRYVLPAGTAEVHIVSRSGVPAGHDLAAADCRRLGARIGAVFLDGDYVPLDCPLLASGFHKLEQRQGELWRWTDGAARLLIPETPARTRPVTLELLVRATMPSWQPPAHAGAPTDALRAAVASPPAVRAGGG